MHILRQVFALRTAKWVPRPLESKDYEISMRGETRL